MSEGTPFGEEIWTLVGDEVVVDTRGPFLYIGTLESVNSNSLRLSDVDVHDRCCDPHSHRGLGIPGISPVRGLK